MKQGNHTMQKGLRLKPLTVFVKRALFPSTILLLTGVIALPVSLAGPEGGVVIGGTGSISQSGFPYHYSTIHTKYGHRLARL